MYCNHFYPPTPRPRNLTESSSSNRGIDENRDLVPHIFKLLSPWKRCCCRWIWLLVAKNIYRLVMTAWKILSKTTVLSLVLKLPNDSGIPYELQICIFCPVLPISCCQHQPAWCRWDKLISLRWRPNWKGSMGVGGRLDKEFEST